jgi:hypothetical protein
MKNCLVLALLIAAANLSSVTPQSREDSLAVKAAAANYILGYYDGDAVRMEKALHPELAKRIVRSDPKSGRQWVDQMSALTLINITKAGGGKSIPADKRIFECRILDITGSNASVKTAATGFFDYIHLAKWNGEWKIVNVLWDFVKN